MYPVPPSTSPISGTPRFWTSAPRWLWGLSNLELDKHARLVVGYAGSTSCQSNDCVSLMCIWQDSFVSSFGRSTCLAAVSHNCKYLKRYPPHTQKCAWNRVRLIPCPLKDAKNIEEAWHNAVGTLLSQLRHLDITGPAWKRDCADGFQRQCYPLLAAWVGDYLEQVMVAQVSNGSCPMCEIPTGALMGHSTFWPLDNSRHRHRYLQLLEENNLDPLYTLGVHSICNQFWQYPPCNVYRLWQTDELHQLLPGLVKDLLNWLLKYQIGRNIKDQFDIRFTSVP